MIIKCKLRVILAEREIKHGEFAEKVEISKAALSALINKRTLPTLEVAYRISEFLGMRIEDIWVKEPEGEKNEY